jgi:membrane associated rhomboid family serine protease
MKFLDKFEMRHRRFGIDNLMMHITIITGVVYLLQYIGGLNIVSYIYLNADLVVNKLQLWRLVTFIFVPGTASFLFIIISLMFYYFIGSALEQTWGKCKFTLYYLVCMLGTIGASFIYSGSYTAVYINLSLFLAFASLYPEYEVLLFFILRVKVKYLAWASLALILWSFIVGNGVVKLSIAASFIGLILFFSPEWYAKIQAWIRRTKYKNRY